MLTNLAGQQDAETALAKGAVKYIIKSEHEPKEVADMVNEVIAGYTRNEVPGASPASSVGATTPVAVADPVTPASAADPDDADGSTTTTPASK